MTFAEALLRNDGRKQSRIIGKDFRALVIDIETAPNLAYVWGLWDQRVGLNQIVEVSTVLCFAAKWLGDPDSKIMYHSSHGDGHDQMICAAWELFNEADALIHFNGRNFDVKHLNREFLLAGLAPPSPHDDIDLLTAARARFKFASNKLDHISQQLGIGSKLKHSGFELWTRCMAGDDKAWAEMERYNVQDVKITEAVYLKLLPWIKNHPNVALFTGELSGCPTCGSTALEKRGKHRTRALVYDRYRCKECGKYSRGSGRLPDTTSSIRAT